MFDLDNPFSNFTDTNQQVTTTRIIKSRVIKSRAKFTPQEDTQLRTAVAQCTDANGDINWEAVATSFPNRIKKQLKERWKNYLDPQLTKEQGNKPWTPEDEKKLLEWQKDGQKLKDMARLLGRTYPSVQIKLRRLTKPGLKQREQQYYQKHKEEINQYQRQRYQENTDHIKQVQANWYQENKKEISQKRKEKRLFGTFNDTTATVPYNQNQPQQQNQAQQQNAALTQTSANMDLAIDDSFFESSLQSPEMFF